MKLTTVTITDNRTGEQTASVAWIPENEGELLTLLALDAGADPRVLAEFARRAEANAEALEGAARDWWSRDARVSSVALDLGWEVVTYGLTSRWGTLEIPVCAHRALTSDEAINDICDATNPPVHV